jgi:hypothetical protein
MKLQPTDERVQRYLLRHFRLPLYLWETVTDPRDRRGIRWPLRVLLQTALLGMLTACRTLRDVEALTDEMKGTGRALVPRRVPDSTLYDLFPRLDVEQMREQVRRQAHQMWRAKSLEPWGLPCGVLSFDGKQIGALPHDAAGGAQKAHRSHDGSPYWLSRVSRAVLTSAASRPCLDQQSVPADTNEMGMFGDFFDTQVQHHGALFEIATGDAGMTSLDNASRVHAADKGYVLALKENQPELRAEAERLLVPLTAQEPLAQTPWERVNGKWVRRLLYRTLEMEGYWGWSHLKQVWLVRQETRSHLERQTTPRPGSQAVPLSIVHEDRYFLSNLTQGRLKPQQILTVVRGHWGIENDCFWSLDMQLHEDEAPWCTQGRALEVLGVLRLMAYNLLQLARKRHLRQRRLDGGLGEPPAWRRVLEWVRQALRLPLLPTMRAGGP